MKKKLPILFVLTILILLTTIVVSAQKPPYYKRIKLVNGHKIVLKGKVYEVYDFNYEFDAKGGTKSHGKTNWPRCGFYGQLE